MKINFSHTHYTFLFICQWIKLCSFAVHHTFFEEAEGTSPSIQVSKAIVLWTSTAISLTLHISFSFLRSKRTICHTFSYQHSLIRITWRDTGVFLETERIDWDSFQLKVEALDETKCSFQWYFIFRSQFCLQQIFNRQKCGQWKKSFMAA